MCFYLSVSQERRRQLELPGLFSKLTNFRQKPSQQVEEERSYGHLGTLTRQTGTLTRYPKDSDHLYYGPMKNLQESDRDMSSSSPVLLEMYDHVKVSSATSYLAAALQIMEMTYLELSGRFLAILFI